MVVLALQDQGIASALDRRPHGSLPVSAPQVGCLQLAAGRSLLLPDRSTAADSGVLAVLEGVARVACEAVCPGVDCGAFTVAFLQGGEQVTLQQLCAEGIVIEALTPVRLRLITASPEAALPPVDPVSDWTLQLLRLRHLPLAERRLQALLALLAERFGRRCAGGYALPFRLSHGRIAELIGTTRVTTTRLLSRLRQQQLLIDGEADAALVLSAAWIEAAPLITA